MLGAVFFENFFFVENIWITSLQMQFLTKITNLLLFFMKVSRRRMKIVKYGCISACISRHFNNFIRNDCSDYSPKYSFSRASIWYKTLCDISYTLSCRWERIGFVTPCSIKLNLRVYDLATKYQAEIDRSRCHTAPPRSAPPRGGAVAVHREIWRFPRLLAVLSVFQE